MIDFEKLEDKTEAQLAEMVGQLSPEEVGATLNALQHLKQSGSIEELSDNQLRLGLLLITSNATLTQKKALARRGKKAEAAGVQQLTLDDF